ncbi:MAG: ATP-binding protein [bacterium]|nr:ATP-binding protein [bacterium]
MKLNLFARLLSSHIIAVILSLAVYIISSRLISAFLPFSILLVVLSICISCVAALFISVPLNRRLEKMAAFIESVANKNFDRSILPGSGDKMGLVEGRLAHMALALKSSFGKLVDERGQRESVIASMGEGVIVIDKEGRVTLSNKKANELFGKSLVGKPISEVARSPQLLGLVEEARGSWSAASGEMLISEPSEMTFFLSIVPLIRNLYITGSVIVFHDITTLKKLERMRKDFVLNVSHELKTPLTSINGFAETLIEGAIDDRENALKFVGVIKRNTERLTRIVEDLLTLSNIEMGKVDFNIKSINMADPVDTVISTLRQKAGEKGVAFKIAVDKSLTVMADKDRLEQILINLIDNGIKFSEGGLIKLIAERKGEYVLLSVRDSGGGIPAKDLPRIGERFYRVDSARSRELGGTGLGLAIVKHLISSMGGNFFVESVEGEGTTVSFTLPKG